MHFLLRLKILIQVKEPLNKPWIVFSGQKCGSVENFDLRPNTDKAYVVISMA